MEIRICLDRLEPPAGRLRLVRDPGPPPADVAAHAEHAFAGWLGMLRALYEVMGSPGDRPPAG